MQSKVVKGYTTINKRHWNARAQRERANKMDMLRLIRDNVSSYFERFEPKLAPYLKNVKGKKIIVPQFGDALVMLACAKKGAIVTGVDLSHEQIRFAKESAEYCGVKVNLIEADWQNLPKYGKLIVSDFHPLSVITKERDGKVNFKRSYFDQSPEICRAKGDIPPSVEFRWKLSDIINAAIRAGFRIEGVEEYFMEQESKRLPLLPTDFLLVATKR